MKRTFHCCSDLRDAGSVDNEFFVSHSTARRGSDNRDGCHHSIVRRDPARSAAWPVRHRPCGPSLRRGRRKRPDLGTRAVAVAPEPEQPAYLLDREAQVARVGDEAQRVDIGLRIVAVSAVAARRRGDEPDLPIMADHPLRDAARLCGHADVHNVTRLSRSALVTTLTDDKAIAAAARTGESRIPKNG